MHIVYLSQLHAASDSPLRFLRYHAAVEEALRKSEMAYTNLRPNLYMRGLLMVGRTIASEGRFFAPAGDARVSVVDVRNIAAIAVAALNKSGHEEKPTTSPDRKHSRMPGWLRSCQKHWSGRLRSWTYQSGDFEKVFEVSACATGRQTA